MEPLGLDVPTTPLVRADEDRQGFADSFPVSGQWGRPRPPPSPLARVIIARSNSDIALMNVASPSSAGPRGALGAPVGPTDGHQISSP
jgi:hypothetical protein